MSDTCYMLLRGGTVEGCGDGDPIIQPGQRAVLFDSRRDRSQHPQFAEWDRQRKIMQLRREMKSMCSEQAYKHKREEAYRYLSHCVEGGNEYIASEFPHIEIEVRARSCDPLTVAKLIIEAVKRKSGPSDDELDTENRRVAMREKILQLTGQR